MGVPTSGIKSHFFGDPIPNPKEQMEALDKLEDSLKSIQSEEKKFLDGITDKYGQGTLNPETGVFTPTASENKSE